MEKLTIMNYDGIRCETDIDMDSINSLYVVVVSGDEIVTAVLKDGEQITFDSAELSGDFRSEDFFDGDYGVHKADLERWTKRKDSYEWFGVLKGGILDAEM